MGWCHCLYQSMAPQIGVVDKEIGIATPDSLFSPEASWNMHL